MYRTKDGTTYSPEVLRGIDPGENEELASLVVLSKAGIQQEDDHQSGQKETDKLKKAVTVVQLSGGPRKVRDASIAVATNNVLQEAIALRGLSLLDPACVEICAQGYVSHMFKKVEEKMTEKKLATTKQFRTIRGPCLAAIDAATSLVTTVPIFLKIAAMICSYPLKHDLFFLFILMNIGAALVGKMMNLTKGSDYWEKRQVLLTLPSIMMEFPFIREVVALNAEVDTVEKAFVLWCSLNPQDKKLWASYHLKEKADLAVADAKENNGKDPRKRLGDGPPPTKNDNGDHGSEAGDSVSSKMSTATGKTTSMKRQTNPKAKAANNKTKGGRAAMGAIAEEQEAEAQEAQMGADAKNNKRPTLLRSPEQKQEDGKFLKSKHMQMLRQIQEEEKEALERQNQGPSEVSVFDKMQGTDKGRMMMELREPLRVLAEEHQDRVAAEALKKLCDAWILYGKVEFLKIVFLVAFCDDPARTTITLRSILFMLELVCPGLSLLAILTRNLEIFGIFGLPMAPIFALQESLRDAMCRVSAATGLKGDLLTMVVVKSGRVSGLSYMMDMCKGKSQGVEAIRKAFQGLLTIPQRHHHMPAAERADALWPDYNMVEQMGDGKQSNILRHDIGLILWSAQLCVAYFKVLLGLRSLRAAKRKETGDKYSYAVVSGMEGSMKEWKQNIEDENEAKKLEAAVKKMKDENMKKMDIIAKTKKLEFKTPFSDDALEIFEVATKKLPSEVMRYGPAAACLEETMSQPSIYALVKKPCYGSNPYVFGDHGERMMQKIASIVAKTNKQSDAEKKAELKAIFDDLDNWMLQVGLAEDGRGVLEREEDVVDDAEPSGDELVDDFGEEVEIGSFGKFVGKIFRNN
eukprot:g19579.t1